MDKDALRECIYLAGQLLTQIEQERENMHSAISGEVLTSYLCGTDQMERKTKQIRKNLVDLQDVVPCGL